MVRSHLHRWIRAPHPKRIRPSPSLPFLVGPFGVGLGKGRRSRSSDRVVHIRPSIHPSLSLLEERGVGVGSHPILGSSPGLGIHPFGSVGSIGRTDPKGVPIEPLATIPFLGGVGDGKGKGEGNRSWWLATMATTRPHANVDMHGGVDGIVTGTRRGRPKGQPAWNKGKKLNEAHKAKIGQALKDKWKEETHRERVSQALRGNVPWNKGKHMDQETKDKMRQAKLGTVATPNARRKIAQAHLGREVCWETRERISQALQGIQKTDAHKRKIATTQRKRAAATRVLRAVEGVSRGETTEAGSSSSFRSNGKLTSKQKKSKAEILRVYKFQLSEYRALKEELEPWATAFLEKYGRKPRLSDVEDTRISWLIHKFKQYMVLKNNLLTTLPSLRNELDGSEEAQEGMEDKQQRHAEANRTGEGRWAQAIVAAHGYSEQKKKDQNKENENNPDSKAHITSKTLLSATNPRGVQAVNAAIEYRRKRAAELAGKAKTAAEAARNITPTQ